MAARHAGGMPWQWLETIETVSPTGAEGTAFFGGARYDTDDHFPGAPQVPGVLQLEAMAQLAGWWLAWHRQFVGKAVLASVQMAQFRKKADPAERFLVWARPLRVDGNRVLLSCELGCGEERVAACEVTLRWYDFSDPNSPFGPTLSPAWMMERFDSMRGEEESV